MRNSVKMLVVPALVLAAACGRDDKPIDEALRNDLSLASSMQPYQPQQFVSPMELGYGGYGYGQYAQPQPNGYYYPQRAAAGRAAPDLPGAARERRAARTRPARPGPERGREEHEA